MQELAMLPAGDVTVGGRLAEVACRLQSLRDDLLAAVERELAALTRVDPACRNGALNLLYYLEFRRHDLRSLQEQLARLGLSSLGRAEAHVLASVDAALAMARSALYALPPPSLADSGSWESAARDLRRQSAQVLGPVRSGRENLIMVTLPSAAADDESLVQVLLDSGMDCARINCAHDDAAVWMRMVGNLRRAQDGSGRRCRVLMDLAGPKLRTGRIAARPAVIKVRPVRDEWGRVVRNARIWLTRAEAPRPSPESADAVVPVSGPDWRSIRIGTRLDLYDARGAQRRWNVTGVDTDGAWVECDHTSYVIPGLALKLPRNRVLQVAEFSTPDQALTLYAGDMLVLGAHIDVGVPAVRDSQGSVIEPAAIGCTLPEVIGDVRAGESVWFDDGRIGGVVERAGVGELRIRITHAAAHGSRLHSDKGINFPDSLLHIDALTVKDLEDLRCIVHQADMVGLSFANGPDDVAALQRALRAQGRDLPIVLKVETRRGFQNLPGMLLAAMRNGPCSVMIARGDLAVECGFERLAEIQEEILWLCEAAHMPVIWATQVLESMARKGQPSRAEITDAAMSHRAECVMLNKGPYVVQAVRMLDDILQRMRGHQNKKTSRLRPLGLARSFWTRERSVAGDGAPAAGAAVAVAQLVHGT